LFDRNIAAVDLRLLDRVTVRLRTAAAPAPAETNKVPDVPTASTKAASTKGKT
jgi:hypothetical protein